MILTFDEWRPDLAPLSPGPETALNVLPVGDGYIPLPMPVHRGPDGLPGAPSLLAVAVTSDGITVPLAYGPAQVWRATSTSWLPVGRPGGYQAATPWAAERWGDNLYSVNGRDPLQVYQIGGTTFADVPDLPAGLTARFLARVGDFLVMADTRDTNGGNRNPFRIQWSGIGRPEVWGTQPAVQADFTDRPGIGRLMGLTGGEYGLILGEDGLDRMDYVGPPVIFQFATLETDVGCEAPRSVIRAGDRTFWWSRRGWRMSQGAASVPIGQDKVDRWFLAQHDPEALDRMTATALYREQVVLWAFVSHASPDGLPDEALCYSWAHDRWSHGKMRVQCFGRAASPALFTDDEPPFVQLTDDSDVLTDSFGDGRTFPGALVDGALCLMQPASGVVAELSTTELAITEGRRTKVTRVRPLVHGAPSLWLRVDMRETQYDESLRTKGIYSPEDVSGSIAVHCAARYHTFRLSIRAPFKRAQGIELVEMADAGRR